MNREFNWEYLQECDLLVEKFVAKAKGIQENVFLTGQINLEKPIRNFVWESIFFGNNRTTYSELRVQQLGYAAFIETIWQQKIAPLLPDRAECESLVYNKVPSPFTTLLAPFRNSILFYCINDRQLEYYRPILEAIDAPVTILTRKQLNEHCIFRPNIQIIEYELVCQDQLVQNDYILNKFPFIFYMASTLEGILNSLSPSCAIFLEGCHFETEVAAAVCKSENIPTACIQQGWPSLMHTRFKNMSYDYFLTWGEAFNRLWSSYNPAPVFKEMGYLYPISSATEKTGIAFFFQSPIFVIDEHALDQMIQFLIHCASNYPERKILLRAHPEHRLDACRIIETKKYSNIVVASDWPIAEVFRQSEIGVSIFSSTLMEGILHDTIPFVFNVTSYPGYYPDVQKEEIGMEVKNYTEAVSKMGLLVNGSDLGKFFRNNIKAKRGDYFEAVAGKAIANIIRFIKTITDKTKDEIDKNS